MNDFRPIALTCSIMKCFENILLKWLLNQVSPYLDQMQFAYRENRGVEDAVLVFLHKLYSHLDTMRTYIRSLFIDFSIAFNTLIPHLLIRKLTQMNVHPQLVQNLLLFYQKSRLRSGGISLSSFPGIVTLQSYIMNASPLLMLSSVLKARADTLSGGTKQWKFAVRQLWLLRQKWQILKLTLPQKNGHRIKTPSSKLMILVSFCWKRNSICFNAHNC